MNCCIVCGCEYDFGGVCEKCTEVGWWMDPAGGLHSPEDDEPWRMYE